MIITCPNCGREFEDYTGWAICLGRRTIVWCHECHMNGANRVDSNTARTAEKNKKARLNKQ